MIAISLTLLLCVSTIMGQNDPDCGTKGPSSARHTYNRIVGGTNTGFLEFPWQISLRKLNTGGTWYHTCGGSIIRDQWILTAAHCVDSTSNPTQYIVRVGEHDRSKDEGTEVDMTVSQVIKHQQYNSQTIDNDVAILKLTNKLDLKGTHNYLGTICLATKSNDVAAGAQCISTGWGNTAWLGTSSKILHKVTTPIVDQTVCSNEYSGIKSVTKGMICSGTGGKGTCQGDSGGPLQCKTGGVWTQHGATSWAVQCAHWAYPSVATRIAEYSDWVWAQVAAN